ncbi:putative inorganic phosphate cotransporter [Trichonephila clavipes]|nr:putative inorganic phosphate cotransporter [Trichonephila clavipes]
MPLCRFQRQYEQLSQFERDGIIGMMEAGGSAGRVARPLGRSDCVVRSKESRFNLSSDDNRVGVWRPRGERLNPAFALQRHTAPTSGVMVWVLTYSTRSRSMAPWQPSASHGKGVTRLSPHCYYPSLAYPTPRFVSNRAYLGSFGMPPTPWKSILTSMPFWALLVTHVGESWGFYTLIIQMPMYLSKILHYDINQNGALSALPSLMLSIVSILSSILADKLRAKGKWRITAIRKILNSIGFFGPAICLTAVAFLGCRPIIIVVLLSLAMGLNGFAFSGFICTHVDMSPDFAGTLYGITNCFSNFTGFLVPAFVGWIIEDGQTVKNWGIVFVTAAVILLVTGVIYDIFCSAESQPWGMREVEQPLEKKPLDKEDEPSRYNPNMCSSKI